MSLNLNLVKYLSQLVFIFPLIVSCDFKTSSKSENSNENLNAQNYSNNNLPVSTYSTFDPATEDLSDKFKVGDTFTYLGLIFTITQHYHGDIIIRIQHPVYSGSLNLILDDVWSRSPVARLDGHSCSNLSIMISAPDIFGFDLGGNMTSSEQFKYMVDDSANNLGKNENANKIFDISNDQLCVPRGDSGEDF